MLCQYCSLGMFFSRKAITMACVVLLFCTTQLLHSTSALAASKPALAQDPSVIIAIDETPSSCITTKIVENPKTHKQIYKQQKKCASGTVVGTKTVPASYAKAHHESYVGVLPVHASSSEIQKWSAQVDQLMQQKRPTLKAVTRQAKASCLDAGQQVWEYSGYQNKLDDTVQGEVVYILGQDILDIFLLSVVADAYACPVKMT